MAVSHRGNNGETPDAFNYSNTDRERDSTIELSEDDCCVKELSDSGDFPDKFQFDAG